RNLFHCSAGTFTLPLDCAPFDYAQGAGVRLLNVAEKRLLSEVEATVDCEKTPFDCAPFDYAQGADCL
ncbi:hypothetical protein, partial [Caldithrix abyssi]